MKEKDWSDYQNNTLNNKVENLLIEFLDNYKDINNFVDLGCGAGNESVYLLKRGYKVTSIDRQLNKDFILNRLTEEVFDILRNIDRSIIVITKSFDDILVQRYIQQYSNVTIKNNNLFHDRYIILDRKTIYISGSSLKDIGKKYSYIYKINEEMFIEELIKRVENIL